MERIGEIIRRQQFIIEEGCHMRDSLIVVLEGQFQCAIGERNYIAGENAVCVFPEGVPFRRKVLEPLRCVYLQFEKFPRDLPAGLLELPDPERAASTVQYLAKAVEEKDEERTGHYLQDLFYLASPSAHTPDISDRVVRNCIRYMDEALAEPVTLEELAAGEAVSRQTLIRKFRKFTGMTPMQYLAAARMNESKILLRDTDLTVSQIALQCGFENVYYFSNYFRKFTGMTPTQYRKNNRL